MLRRWTIISVLTLLLWGAIWLQVSLERLGPLPVPAEGASTLFVRSPEAARRMALSYDALAADIYWMRAIQYYGTTKLSKDVNKTYDQLYPLLDLTTSLDPSFKIAYRFGAIFLAEPYPAGAGRPDLATALLKKGLEAQPDRWEYAQDIGFIYYWWLRDFPKASEWFVRASEIPKAPNWLKPLAAVTLTQGGNRASSRVLWEQVLASAEVDWLRGVAMQRLRQLDAMDHIDLLRRILDEYRRRQGMRARSWQDLVAAGYLRQVPRDPEGHYYVLDPERNAVTLGPKSPLNPLPTEPTRLAPV